MRQGCVKKSRIANLKGRVQDSLRRAKRWIRPGGYLCLPLLGLFSSSLGVAKPIEGIDFSRVLFQQHRYVTTTLDLTQHELEHFWINEKTGQNFHTLSALRRAINDEGDRLIFAVNSGIYTKENRPLGLHIEDGEELIPLNRVKFNEGQGNFSLLPNGVFYLDRKGRAHVVETDRFAELQKQFKAGDVTAATQSGPMLLINGRYNPHLIEGSDSLRLRSGVCAQDEGQTVHFVVTEDDVSFHEFASFFKEELACENALYLDGTLARFYVNNRLYGAPFWRSKPLVGIWGVRQKGEQGE